MSGITRRNFLITGAAAVGSCFVPSWLLRRAADYEKTTGGIFIDPPESARSRRSEGARRSRSWRKGNRSRN